MLRTPREDLQLSHLSISILDGAQADSARGITSPVQSRSRCARDDIGSLQVKPSCIRLMAFEIQRVSSVPQAVRSSDRSIPSSSPPVVGEPPGHTVHGRCCVTLSSSALIRRSKSSLNPCC